MLEHAARKITSLFINKGIINSEEHAVYAYGFELLLSTAVNFLCVGLVALFTGTIWQTIVYMGTFLILRSFAGGYHADTHFRCVSLMMIYYIGFLLLLYYMPITWYIYFNCLTSCLSFIIVFLKSPVEHENKPLNKTEISFLKKRARITVSIFLMVTVLTAIWPSIREFSMCVASGMLTSAAALVMVVLRDSLHGFLKKQGND